MYMYVDLHLRKLTQMMESIQPQMPKAKTKYDLIW